MKQTWRRPVAGCFSVLVWRRAISLTEKKNEHILSLTPLDVKEMPMRWIFLHACLVLILVAGSAAAGEVREIEMNDGSIISAEVLSLAGGVYTVRSASLGTIKLEESKVRAIRSRPAEDGTKKGEQPPSSGELRSIQDKMLSDKEIMGMIQSLQDDPGFKKILEDPDMMKAVNSGDITTLMANPEFMKLLNNATVQDIQKKVK